MTGPKTDKPQWIVSLSPSANRAQRKMPTMILDLLSLLIRNIEELGPVQKGWKNFSDLAKSKLIPVNSYHCHLKKGRPTYVACWRKVGEKTKKIEIFYVGTHENAPY